MRRRFSWRERKGNDMRKKIFLSPARYLQGRGILKDCAGELMDAVGARLLLIADEVAMEHAGNALCEGLQDAGAAVWPIRFNGQSSLKEIERIAAEGAEKEIDGVIAVGGGKTCDTARGVKDLLKAALAVVPTIASTDAPAASLYAIYSEEDEVLEYRYTKNPDLVLVDTEVIAKAPARFLASGIADALATWMEARACAESDSPTTTGGHATLAGLAIAERCEQVILQYGVQAYEANKAHVVTKAFDAVVEANILLSGIGYESGGLAAAHSIHNGLTVLPGKARETSHGEKVAFGTLVQLFLENRDRAEIDRLVRFYRELDLPTTLAELGLQAADHLALERVGAAATAEGETIHNMPFQVTGEDVVDAILAADQYITSHF